MATSGVVTITQTTDGLIRGAARLLHLYQTGEGIPKEKYNNALSALNEMMREWQTQGVGIWTKEDIALFPQKDSQFYALGPSGDNATFNPFSTELAADAAAGASTITVDDDDDITNGDNIGVELDTGFMQYTTVNGAPSANVVTLTDVLTGAVSENNTVVNYTTKINRPIDIDRDNVRYRNKSGDEQPLLLWPRQRFFAINQRNQASAAPSIGFFQPRLTNSRLYIWPPLSDVDGRIMFSALMPIETFVGRSNTPDLPDEWMACIRWNLAKEWGAENRNVVPGAVYAGIISEADKKFKMLNNFDSGHRSMVLRRKSRDRYYDYNHSIRG